MNHIDTMKLALEALEWNMGYLPSYGDGTRMAINAITALREALAEQPATEDSSATQAAQQALDKMAENARELGLDYEPVCNKDPQGCWNVRCQLGKKCKNTPAQQEPVATITITQRGPIRIIDNNFDDCVRGWPDGEYNLYTSPHPAQQEPVAWLVCENWRKHSLFFTEEGAEDFKNAAQREDALSGNLARWKAKPLYTSPQEQPSKPWVGLTPEQRATIAEANNMLVDDDLFDAIEAELKEKNT